MIHTRFVNVPASGHRHRVADVFGDQLE